VIIRRLLSQQSALEAHVGWALVAGGGGFAIVKAAYPLYLLARYRAIDIKAIDDIGLYIYGGSLAAMFLGVALIAKSLKMT
jgi:hypothetical protein